MTGRDLESKTRQPPAGTNNEASATPELDRTRKRFKENHMGRRGLVFLAVNAVSLIAAWLLSLPPAICVGVLVLSQAIILHALPNSWFDRAG